MKWHLGQYGDCNTDAIISITVLFLFHLKLGEGSVMLLWEQITRLGANKLLRFQS